MTATMAVAVTAKLAVLGRKRRAGASPSAGEMITMVLSEAAGLTGRFDGEGFSPEERNLDCDTALC